MEIKKFIKIYDEVLPIKVISNLIRFANKVDFEKAGVITDNQTENNIDFNTRRTFVYALNSILSDSLSNVHWCSLLGNTFKNQIMKYHIDLNIIDFRIKAINDISILKYENTGFYTWHTDHAAEIPRTISCILLLNNDYEGGNLCFRNPDGSEEWEVDVKPNRMIIWPSNFLYPHTVKPVTKGRRYSVVAWAL